MIASRVWLPSTAVWLVASVSSAGAQPAATAAERPSPVVQLAAASAGAIYGAVVEPGGAPVEGAVVSALGGATAFAVTDKAGQYHLAGLPAGPYVVRVHREGFAGGKSVLVNVRPAAKAPSSFTLRRVDTEESPTVLAAGVPASSDAISAPRDESALAWRLRRLTRSVLKDDERTVDLGEVDDTWFDAPAAGRWARAIDASTRFATDVLFDGPLYGQVNLLTATAFDDSGEMVHVGNSSGAAFFAVGAPVGEHADWSARVAMMRGDLTSWTMAGDYSSRPTARQHVALGLTYSLQAYRGGNFAALAAVPDGHRKVGSVYGEHELSVAQSWKVGYGARYEHYDYLGGSGLLSPSLKLTFLPTSSVRVHAKASQQQVAPGAEEFVPPLDAQWVPLRRTFAPLAAAGSFAPERVRQLEVGVTREFEGATFSVRAFRQAVNDQLVTVFGTADASRLVSAGGHYGLASAGDAEILGWAAGLSGAVNEHVRGRVEYTVVQAAWSDASLADRRALSAIAPEAIRPDRERLHHLSASLDAAVPQTDTRVVVLYKVNTGISTSPTGLLPARGRFDVELRQGLPFIGDSAGEWKMLVGVRSLFRATLDDRSLYDELLVVRAPKRVIGGLQVRF